MSFLAEVSRTAPVRTTIRDLLVEAWVRHADAGAPGAGADVWVIDVAGQEHTGPAVDPVKHATQHDAKEMLRAWAKEHPALFD